MLERTTRLPLTSLLHIRSDLWLGLRAGGSITHANGVLAAFEQRGFGIASLGPEPIPGRFASKWLGVTPSRVPRGLGPFAPIYFARQLENAVPNGVNPTLCYGRHALMSDAALRVAHKLGATLVLEVNNLSEWHRAELKPPRSWIQWPVIKALESRVLRSAAVCLAVSEAVGQELRSAGVDEARILVRPNGVDPDLFGTRSDSSVVRSTLGIHGGPIVGFVGTFGAWHGVANLLRAFAQLRGHGGAKLLLVGDGPERKACEQLCVDLQLTGRVIFAGTRVHEEIPALLRACDVLVAPFSWPRLEPFIGSPTKLFEYMASGRPIVASALGQVRDVLSDGESALLVPPDDIAALANGIARLLGDPSLGERLASCAQTVVRQRFTWRRNVDALLMRLQDLGISAS